MPSSQNWFDDLPVLGKLPPEQAAAKLRELGDEETATTLESVKEITTRSTGTFKSPRSWYCSA
jgi:hypothetical protein